MIKNLKVPQKNNLRIIPLGGCEEVGRNMTVFEYGHDIIILDMGLQFPEEDMPGIDYIIPNANYLKGKEKRIRGVVETILQTVKEKEKWLKEKYGKDAEKKKE